MSPRGNVFLDASGNLLGTTRLGGAHDAGSVFELSLNPPILSFAAPPVSTTAGSAINSAAGVQVNVSYPWGNVDAADNSNVTLTLSGSSFSGGSATACASLAGRPRPPTGTQSMSKRRQKTRLSSTWLCNGCSPTR